MKSNAHRALTLFAALLALLMILGCASGQDPSSPEIAADDSSASTLVGPCHGKSASQGRVLWGIFQVELHRDTLEASVVPLRGAMFNANVTKFLQPPFRPTHLLSISIDIGSSEIENDLLAVDVTIRHPFPGLTMYRGFDVRGIFMAGASQTAGFDPTARYANWFDAAPGVPSTESVLLNADGYTRWWNPTEFTSYGTIFGYTRGGLSPPGYSADATLNPFKYFADSLGVTDPFDIAPETRGTFSATPGINARRYMIQFNGKPWMFNYAVDASWAEPDPSGAPDYPVDSFPPEANSQEAYKIVLTDAGSTAWYESPGSHGGYFIIDVEVFDWQSSSGSTVIDEMVALWVESGAFDDGTGNHYVDLLAGAYETLPGSGETSAIVRAQVDADFTPGGIDSAGNYPVLIAVESADPNTYEPQIDGGGGAFDYPDAPLAAYNVAKVQVKAESPMSATLVLEEPEVFEADQAGYHAYSPAIVVENDGDVVFAYCEWDPFTSPQSSYASAFRSKDDGDTWPDWEWNQHYMGSVHAGDATKIWPSSHDLSYRTANLADFSETTFGQGHAAGTFIDGPNGSEKANLVNMSIDHANEILQDSDKYVYILGDAGGQIAFKRSDSPECLNCTPPPAPWNWYPLPTYTLVNPGRLSRARSSALYSDTMYLAYFEPSGDVIRLAQSSGDGLVWDTSTIIWDADGSGAHLPRDPGLQVDETGFHVVFVRTEYLTGFNELCHTWSADGSEWSEPVVIRSNVFDLMDAPICAYDWDGTSTLGTVWCENEKIWAAFCITAGTWSDPVLVSETYEENKQCDLAIAPSGNWHFVFASRDPVDGMWEIHYRRGHMIWE